MIKTINALFVGIGLVSVVLSIAPTRALAQFYPAPGTPLATPYVTPEPCASGQGHVPPGSRSPAYCPNLARACDVFEKNPAEKDQCLAEAEQYVKTCANSYEEWLDDKERNFWVKDPEVTSLGKGGERSRSFILWVLTHPSIDDHPVLLDVWKLSRNVAMFLILIVVIIMGIGIIVGQRNNFSLSIEISPLIIKLAILLLYLVFSARVVILIVQVSDVMMEFFIRNLGVRELFNIFFVDVPSGNVLEVSERAYRVFTGCTNLNINNIEMVRTSKFLVKFTNMTYYFLGIMFILRKIILWFLLIVSPFLVILAPFVFVRNTGWIWIGVFFQWIFYGPLMSLFLGALARIWNSPTHIPFIFDFSRVNKMSEAVYPTSINILYGGPAQTLGIWNTSNYVDTFAEYVISLLMLWTVIILPWWLLRIFRDYCCDGIYAMKNILLSMYDSMRTGPGGQGPTPPSASPRPTGTAGTALKLPKKIDMPVETKIKIETVQEIKSATTENIVRSIDMRASNITEIARMETQKNVRENVTKNINSIQNPYKAETPTERQKVMNLKDEIESRASRGDQMAQGITAVTSRSTARQQIAKERILQSMPKMVPVIQTVSVTYNIPKEKTKSIINKVFANVVFDHLMVDTIAHESQMAPEKTKQVLQSVSRSDQLDRPAPEMIKEVAKETGVKEEEVKRVITKTAVLIKEKKEVTDKVAQEEQIDAQTVTKVMEASLPAVSEPEKHIEQHVAPSKKVSIEEYEDVKGMWIQQYVSGEIPVTENIQTRDQWVEEDTVRISNILNKVLSADKQMQEQGLDEVGYILPIFMINNLSGEELLVYLKAKLEAAKQVKLDIEKEAEIREKVKAEEKETFIDIDVPKKKEAEKAQTLQAELKMDVSEATEETGSKTPQANLPLEEIQNKLKSEMDKESEGVK